MSDQDNSIFEQKAPATSQEQNTNADPIANLLGSIRTEDGRQKYASVEAALVGLQNAQNFIPKVKSEVAERDAEIAALRAEVARIKQIEQSVLELTQRQENSQTRGEALKPEDIEAVVSQTISKREAASRALDNQKLVAETLQKTFGDKAEATFYERAAELDYSKDEINALAAKNPKALFKLMGINEQGAPKQPLFAPTKSTVNSEAFQQNASTAIRRNDRKIELGESKDEIADYRNSAELIRELHAQGLTMADLSIPKIHKQFFG